MARLEFSDSGPDFFSVGQTSLATDTGEMARRRRAAAAAAALRRHLDGCRSLLPLIRRSCAEGWIDAALEALDRAAAGGDRSRACRMLAAVANLLAHAASAASAGSRGAGLTRNGPAHNGQWQPALQLLAVSSSRVFLFLVLIFLIWRDVFFL